VVVIHSWWGISGRAHHWTGRQLFSRRLEYVPYFSRHLSNPAINRAVSAEHIVQKTLLDYVSKIYVTMKVRIDRIALQRCGTLGAPNQLGKIRKKMDARSS